MEGQMTVEQWMSSTCTETKKCEESKSSVVPKRKKFAEKVEPNMNPLSKLTDEQMMSHRENWYALLVAIMREDINSADDALAAMGVKRNYTQQRKRGRRKSAAV